MIQKFVDQFMAAQSTLEAEFALARIEDYDALVKRLVMLLAGDKTDYQHPDPERITVIDHGDYQGTKLYIIGCGGYQPSMYWSIFVPYGSCSGCDAMQDLNERGVYDEPPNEEQRRGYWTLMLHMVQSMRQLHGYGDDE